MGINDPEKLRERFDNSGRTVVAYARAKGLQQTALQRVLSGETNGKRSTKAGQTRKIFCHLKADSIWIGPLPWNVSKESVASKEEVV